MKDLKRSCIIGALFVIITGTLAHFVYDWSGQNDIVGFFTPVSESTWEHMKLCFFPMLLYSLYMWWSLRDTHPCICSALPAGVLAGTFTIPVLFYTYTGIIGKSFLPVDIGIFVVSVIVAFYIIYKLSISCKVRRYTGLLWLTTVILGLCFVLFTYLPPNIGLFREP